MGSAGTAFANDATAAYFNPAGLVNPERFAASLNYSKWLPGLADDLSFWFTAGSVNLANLTGSSTEVGSIGYSVSLLNLGEQIRTDERGNAQGTFRAYDLAIGLSYAYELRPMEMSVGTTIKYIRSNLADQGAGIEQGKGVGNSFALDFGFLWQGILGDEVFVPIRDTFSILNDDVRGLAFNRMYPGFSFGVALKNIGPKIAYIDASQADPLPTHIVIGFGHTLDTDIVGIQTALDIYKPLIADGGAISNVFKAWADESFSDELSEIDIHLGTEVSPLGLFALRLGYSYDSDGELKTGTFGLGFGPETARFNLANISGKDSPMQDNLRFSLDIAF